MSFPKKIDLDLSALAYPMMTTRKTQSLYRFTVTLTYPVNQDLLQQAVEKALPRFPNFVTRLSRGFFWHKLTHNDNRVPVQKDSGKALAKLNEKQTAGFPFRVMFNDKTVILEVFHAITDGNVSVAFLKDIINAYLSLSGYINCDTPTEAAGVTSDAFIRHAEKTKLKNISLKDYAGVDSLSLANHSGFNEIALIEHPVSTDDLLARARAKNASITEYITAAYMCAIVSEQKLPLKRPLSIFIPVNLRRFFPTDTLCNFVTFERVCLQKGWSNPDFDAILESTKTQLRAKITKPALQHRIDSVVKCFTLPILKYCPLFIKEPIFRLGKRLFNKVRQTAIVSNMGAVTFSPEALPFIKDMQLFINISKNAPLNLGALSFNGITHLNFTRLLKKTCLPEKAYRLLTE